MRIVKWEFEGTPDELRQVPELQSAFAGSSDAPVALASAVEGLVPGECVGIIRRWARTPQRAEVLLDLLGRLVRSGLFVLEPGKSEKTEDGLNDYVMVYRRGPKTIGSVAYVMPSRSRVLVRLPAEAAADHPDAEVRGNTGKYRVQYTVDDANGIDPAVELVMAALEYADAA
jgi:hypothetical protein